MRNAKGFTLLEILVTLLLGGLVITAVLQVLVSSRSSYRVQQGLAQLQESGRFAMELLSADLRMAGHRGCLSMVPINVPGYQFQYALNDDAFYDFRLPVLGFEATAANTWVPALDTSPIASTLTAQSKALPLSHTDVFSIRVAEPTDVAITTAMAGNTADLTVTDADNTLRQSDIIVVADCEATAVAQITNNPSGGIIQHQAGAGAAPQNIAASLGKAFGTDAQVFRGVVKSYYIAPSELNPGVPALWLLVNRPSGAEQAIELVEGVQSLAVLYGLDTDGDEAANRYVTADVINTGPAPMVWANVVAVRASLLVQSAADNLASAPQAYTFNGLGYAADRRLRRTFTTTVAVRNSLR